MARRSDAMGMTGNNETIIGTGVSAKGTLNSEADITIDGTFTGEIKAGGNVNLGVNAVVKANVKATNVVVAGNLDGDIIAAGETSIAETGKVTGNITTSLLAIATGAIFAGSVKMTQTAAHLSTGEYEEAQT